MRLKNHQKDGVLIKTLSIQLDTKPTQTYSLG